MIKRIINENDLHEVIINYPELIVGDEPITKIHHEYKKSEKSRIDIIIQTKNKTYIIEVKNRKITYDDIMQTKRYLLETKTKNKTGIIIGRSINKNLQKLAQNLDIKTIIIGKHIPNKLKICANCKKPYPHNQQKCPKCGTKNTELEIHF